MERSKIPVPERPSYSETKKKLDLARKKVSQNDWAPVDPTKLLKDFETLDLWTLEEESMTLLIALAEIKPENYAGGRPPQRSFEEICRGAELFAFTWSSTYFGCQMYLKFCFVKQSLYIVSFHESRSPERR
ncbi:MAG: hypothetical protein HYR55_07645 [Acidobacteria bacterium]|nr:hypothetical protein [Acidobacteriota bacterium]MBI3658296.1 hypothetical protein [Acidobacteriota bacterium]